MDIIAHPSATSTPEVGSAISALLPQLPEPLRAQFQQAYEDDLVYMFTTGMDAGQQIQRDAAKIAARATKTASTPRRTHLRMLTGGAR